MEYSFLKLENDDGLGIVTMNRPPGNALSADFVDELWDMAKEVSSDQEVRAVLFKSALEKHFMVGADLKTLPPDLDLGDLDPSWPPKQVMGHILSKMSHHIASMLEKAQQVMNEIESMPKPVIAAVSGHALGGGLEFSLACDFRIMAKGKPRIGLTETGLGLIPAAGGCQRLPRAVGHAKAVEMILLAMRLDAEEAEAIGLINKAVDPEELEKETTELGRSLAKGATIAMGCAKRSILTGENHGLEKGLEAERESILKLAETSDLAEGLMAFNARTEPDFEGR